MDCATPYDARGAGAAVLSDSRIEDPDVYGDPLARRYVERRPDAPGAVLAP